MDFDINQIIISTSHQQYLVSKSALISCSPVLSSMIQDEVPELFYPIITLDISHEQVTQLIEVIEGRNISLKSVENAKEMYALGVTYQIDKLQKICQDYLIENMNMTNVCCIHDFACQQKNTSLQYYCWKEFDYFWMDIFQTQDFLRSKVSTISRFLSRPKYISISEFELFKAVYNWIKANCQEENVTERFVNRDPRVQLKNYRYMMRSFLPNIRFLLMNRQELEYSVFNLNLLNVEEVRAIRSYLEFEKTENIPRTICSSTTDRTNETYSDLFIYYHKNELYINKDKEIYQKSFNCEICVFHDCFLTSVQLPIYHSNVKGLEVQFECHTDSQQPLVFQYVCNVNGNISIGQPLFLPRLTTSNLYVKISDEEYKNKRPIMIKSGAQGYINDKEHSDIIKKRNFNLLRNWEIIYFNVNLYF